MSLLAIRGVEDVLATTGTNATLMCHASGHPDLQYSWGRVDSNDSFLTPGFAEATRSRVQGECTANLTFLNVELDDAMLYGCNVSLFEGLVGTSVGNFTTRGNSHRDGGGGGLKWEKKYFT